jgi:hypothetical protein
MRDRIPMSWLGLTRPSNLEMAMHARVRPPHDTGV